MGKTRWKVKEKDSWHQHPGSICTCMGMHGTGLSARSKSIRMGHQSSLRLSDYQKNGSKYIRISSETSFCKSKLLKIWGTSRFGTCLLGKTVQLVRPCKRNWDNGGQGVMNWWWSWRVTGSLVLLHDVATWNSCLFSTFNTKYLASLIDLLWKGDKVWLIVVHLVTPLDSSDSSTQ